MYPDWELNRWPFGLQAGAQSTEPHRPGLYYKSLKHRTGRICPAAKKSYKSSWKWLRKHCRVALVSRQGWGEATFLLQVVLTLEELSGWKTFTSECAVTNHRGNYLALRTCGLVMGSSYGQLGSQDPHFHSVWEGEREPTKSFHSKASRTGWSSAPLVKTTAQFLKWL